MAVRKKSCERSENEGAIVGYEAQLWKMADALRGSMDAAEYEHVVLGLIFWVPPAARWQHLKAQARQRTHGPVRRRVQSLEARR